MRSQDNIPEPSHDPPDLATRRIEEQIAWCRRNLDSLARDRRRLPWLLVLLALGVPVWWFWGGVAAALLAGAVIFTVASGLYLVWGHQTEYQQKIAKLQRELRGK